MDTNAKDGEGTVANNYNRKLVMCWDHLVG